VTALAALGLRNRRTIPWPAVPCLPVAEFRRAVLEAAAADWRLVALFGMPDGDRETRLVAVLADDHQGELGALSARVLDRYPDLSGIIATSGLPL